MKHPIELTDSVDTLGPHRLVLPNLDSVWVSPAGHYCTGWTAMQEDGEGRFVILAFRSIDAAEVAADAEAS